MQIIRKSPFKSGDVEKDPKAYGLRKEAIIQCIQAMYNNQHILLSGGRGIGKSSLGFQIQNVLMGDKTLLNRCDIKADFSKTLCIYIACDESTTLDQLVGDILHKLERSLKKEYAVIGQKVIEELEVSLGIFRARFNGNFSEIKNKPASIATELVSGIYEFMKILRNKRVDYNISIMIDEIDQLSQGINFGHFMKIIHEELGYEDLQEVRFIFAGQTGIYKRFTKEDPSFERIVLHVPIHRLGKTASRHIIEFAKTKNEPYFEIDEDCEKMLIALSSGYPYYIHLLGNEAFNSMEDFNLMTISDLLRGMETILTSGKFEKYIERLKQLTKEEQALIIGLSEYSLRRVPARIPYIWIMDKFGEEYIIKKQDKDYNVATIDILNSLVSKGYLNKQENIAESSFDYMFDDELFRIFIALRQINRMEIHSKQKSEAQYLERLEYKKQMESLVPKEERLFEMIKSNEIDKILSELTPEEQEKFIANFLSSIDEADYIMSEYEELWSLD